MAYPAVIFILLVILAVAGIEWRLETRKRQEAEKQLVQAQDAARVGSTFQGERIATLEAEILRLRKIPLTQPPEKADTSVIRAKSPAQVRQITEAAWGKMPELEEVNAIDNGE
jgi:hypothetical protein